MGLYNNKSQLDPGRFRYKIEFFREVSEIDEYGSQITGWQSVLLTKALKSDIKAGDQRAYDAGATVFNQSCYFTIRHRRGFEPEKDMRVVIEGEQYVIAGYVPVDQPVMYYKILCIKSDHTADLPLSVAIQWGYGATEAYQFTRSVQSGAVSLDFSAASAGANLYLKVPESLPVFTSWEANAFNNGQVPDSVWADPEVQQGYRIYKTRNPVYFTSDSSVVEFS